ncbi:3129_t:CDS:2 [Gigaspora rosea]|nr:3129_t:CDS:2 [Gigaspora rosea]
MANASLYAPAPLPLLPPDASILTSVWPPTRVNGGANFSKMKLVSPLSKQKNSDFKEDPMIGKGIPEYTCRIFRNDDGEIIFPIEVKRNLVAVSNMTICDDL